MIKVLLTTLLTLAVFLSNSLASRILVLMPVPMKSHSNLFDPLVMEMASRGHHVTYVTPNNVARPEPNVTVITDLDDYTTWTKQKIEMRSTFAYRGFIKIVQVFMPTIFAPTMNGKFLSEPKVRDLISSELEFDLVIAEAHLDESILAGFSYRFKAPFIGISTFMASSWSSYLVGNPSPSSYIPNAMAALPSRMTFLERLTNTICNLISMVFHEWLGLWLQDRVMREHFGNNLPSLRSIIRNASVVLVNHHHSLSFPRPYLPNMVDIGGFHVPAVKELPQDLKQFMDKSEHGVVLFSLGSYIKGSGMSNTTVRALLDAFSQLQENVLWKFDSELPNLPKNVKTTKWVPQSDILAHRNLKLFITHGGMLSTTEAVHRGVPLVGIPVIGDQPLNMQQVQAAGFGRMLNYNDITSESVLRTIREVLDNPRYRDTVRLRSSILKDRPISPMETAMYWIEYVLRHKGAPHLRSAAQDLAWYQLYLLDVYAVLAIFAAVSLILVFKLIRIISKNIFKFRK